MVNSELHTRLSRQRSYDPSFRIRMDIGGEFNSSRWVLECPALAGQKNYLT